MIAWLLPALAATLIQGPCRTVDSDYIEARHLKGVLPAASQLDPGTAMASAPQAGVRRVVQLTDLGRWASKHGLDMSGAAVSCFEWPLRPVSREQFITSMRQSLDPGVNIRVELISNDLVPPGSVVFPRSGLREPSLNSPNESTLWHGYVQYTPTRRFRVWAKVILSKTARRVVAAKPLVRGDVIVAGSVREESVEQFPYRRLSETRMSDFLGKEVRVPVKPGAILHRGLISSPPDVRRGENVNVEVRRGKAVLNLTAVADSTARVGEIVRLRNPVSGKLFEAKLEAPHRASSVSRLSQ